MMIDCRSSVPTLKGGLGQHCPYGQRPPSRGFSLWYLNEVPSPHEVAARGRVAVAVRQVPAERIRQAIVNVEQDRGVDRVLDAFITHACVTQRRGPSTERRHEVLPNRKVTHHAIPH